MKRLIESISDWINKWPEIPAEGLALLRIFTSLFILFFLLPGYGLSHYEWLASFPDDLYSPPPGPMSLFDGFPSETVFLTIHGLLVVSLICMLTGFYTRFSTFVAGCLILMLQGWIYSIGKTNHELLLAAVPIFMAFSNWGGVWSMDQYLNPDKSPKYTINPVPFLALILGFMMFTAGFPKILGGWLSPDTQAAYGHLLNQYFVKERSAFLAGYFVQFNHTIFWEMLDWATVLFEIGFLISVCKFNLFRVFVCFAVVFHISTLLTLNIAFVPNFIAYAVFLNWGGIAGIFYRLKEKIQISVPIIFSMILAGVFLIVKWISLSDWFLAGSELRFYEVFTLCCALLIVLTYSFKHLQKRMPVA